MQDPIQIPVLIIPPIIMGLRTLQLTNLFQLALQNHGCLTPQTWWAEAIFILSVGRGREIIFHLIFISMADRYVGDVALNGLIISSGAHG